MYHADRDKGKCDLRAEGDISSSREKTKFRLRLKASDESRRFEPLENSIQLELNVALQRLAHTTTNKGTVTASPLQALVGRGGGSKRYFWAAESKSRLNFAALSSLLIANAHCQADS
jgi:hypothetical protein